jgi:hypothetical protein
MVQQRLLQKIEERQAIKKRFSSVTKSETPSSDDFCSANPQSTSYFDQENTNMYVTAESVWFF